MIDVNKIGKSRLWHIIPFVLKADHDPSFAPLIHRFLVHTVQDAIVIEDERE